MQTTRTTAMLALVVLLLAGLAAGTTGGQQERQTMKHPDTSFFQHCAFVCVDVQPGTKHTMTEKQMPQDWRKMGFTVEDVNAAIAYTYNVAHPHAARVARACRRLGLPMIFIHWGFRFEDGMDLDPVIRQSFLAQFGPDYRRWPHHLSRPDSRPAEILDVQPGEYVLPKTAQDAFPSSNLGYVLENLGARNLIFIGGHTGACLGRTAASAIQRGYQTLCVEDATFDATQSRRLPNLEQTGYHYVVTTEEFEDLVEKAIQGG